jgi:hypothetical protein
MLIRRSSPEANFTILPNATLRDDRLSYTARGVLAELLSRPDGWETNADKLAERARRHRGTKNGEGRRALRGAFAELEAAGYLHRQRERIQEGGRFLFTTVMTVYDIPQDRGTESGTSEESYRGTGSGTSETGTSETGMSGAGTSETGTSLRSTDQEDGHEDGLRRVKDEHSSALASARAGALEGDDDSTGVDQAADMWAVGEDPEIERMRQAAAAWNEADRQAEHQKQASSWEEIDRQSRENQELRSKRLHRAWEVVAKVPHQSILSALIQFEQKRPRVFAECRQAAISQFKQENPGVLKGDEAAVQVDYLSFKYAVQHYMPKDPIEPMPGWLMKHIYSHTSADL